MSKTLIPTDKVEQSGSGIRSTQQIGCQSGVSVDVVMPYVYASQRILAGDKIHS